MLNIWNIAKYFIAGIWTAGLLIPGYILIDLTPGALLFFVFAAPTWYFWVWFLDAIHEILGSLEYDIDI